MGNKLDYEFVKSEFMRLKGYILLENEYIDSATPMRYQCPNHPNEELKITYNNLKNGHGCKFCGFELRAEKNKLTIEFVRAEFLRLKGYILLETEYLGVTHKMRYICPHHPDEELYLRYSNLQQGGGCRLCGFDYTTSINRLDFNIVIEEFEKNNYVLLDAEENYKNSNTPLRYKCHRHPKADLKISYSSLKNGSGCKFCALEDSVLTNEEYINKIKHKNVIPLENYIKRLTRIKHQCLICGYKFDASPHYILQDKWKCNYCFPNNQNVIVGINDMWTTSPEQASWLLNPEDGYEYTNKSGKKVDWKCVDCGSIIKNKKISDINNNGLACNACSDGISIPNKFMFNILLESKIDFQTEKRFEWCNFIFNNEIRIGIYDFVVNNLIIEMDGYMHKRAGKSKLTIEEIKFIDLEKDKLAIKNGYEIIRIDCEKSELNVMKHNILNSNIHKYIDLSNIDFDECFRKSLKSKVMQACDLWNNGLRSTRAISLNLKVSISSASRYLKKCASIGLCDYNPKQHSRMPRSSLKLDKEHSC